MSNTTTVVPTIAFSRELSAAAKALAAAAKKLESLSRSLRKQAIDPSQVWFWTEEWQEAERKAEKDIETGQIYELKSIDDLDKPFERLFTKCR